VLKFARVKGQNAMRRNPLQTSVHKTDLDMQELLNALEMIAPLELAEEWDNVGLLLEPLEPGSRKPVTNPRHVFFTIDLTEEVFQEALDAGADVIIAYHPPLFMPIKRLTLDDPKTNIIISALANGIAIYSPHTALDCVKGGVNDWLADGLGDGERRALGEREDGQGPGRLVSLNTPTLYSELVARVKGHLGLERLRCAPAGKDPMITSVALCAGAGSSVISSIEADLYLTGEMRHHDVLAANAAGRSVILCEHTNTERGYLSVLSQRLEALLPTLRYTISRIDADPLQSV